MAEGDLPRVAYRGFLSYSHKDTAAAAKLHRGLETYRLPKQLVDTGVPERLTPIFRDREELSAGADLSVQVREALAGSESLIILCSPAAKASIWVNKEIETFRALHPDRPILAAILDGEPEACFPSALTAGGDEPIAADLRKSGDGWRLGQLKLVAGIAGVPLDALVQRDHARQLRRVTAITVASLITVLIMSALLVFAVRAQRDAERQRAEAEGLVEYMLTDLRDRLKGIGRLDVMTAVNERAMGYYGAQGDLAALEPESLDRRARILHAMGEDDEKRGHLPLALKKFTEAHRTTAAVLAQRPNDPDAIFAHAQSEYWVGYAHLQSGEKKRAKLGFERYRRYAYQLRAIDPKREEWRKEVAYAEGNICTLALQKPRDLASAGASCTKARSEMEQIARNNPKILKAQLDLANRLMWESEAARWSGKNRETLALLARQIRLLEDARRTFPRAANLEQAYLLSHLGLAEQLARMGDREGAFIHASAALMIIRKLVAADPDNKKWSKFQQRVEMAQKNGKES